jgi:hypothetical protein
MLDWQVFKEDDSSSALAEREVPPSRRKRWRLWLALLLFFLLISGAVVALRLKERNEAIEADVEKFVRYEEQQRFFGLKELKGQLVVPRVSENWEEAYLNTFVEPDEAQPFEVEIAEIELHEGEGLAFDALVSLRLNGQAQIRLYQLHGRRWKRAPLSEALWGEERYLQIPLHSMTIFYQARDEEFVQRLAQELPALLANWPNSTRKIIRVGPREFGEPILLQNETEVTLNSPLLVSPKGELDSERRVRFALADALLAEANPDSAPDRAPDGSLEGVMRFRAASRALVILHWLLPHELIPRQLWQEKLTEGWFSPFLAESSSSEQANLSLSSLWEPRPSEAAALLTADYLYQTQGHEILVALASQLSGAQSWDSVFEPALARYAIELEADVQAFMRDEELPTPQRSEPPISLPMTVKMLDIEPRTNNLLVKVPHREEPLSIEAAHATLLAPDGSSFSPNCASLYQDITIEAGDWLDVGQQLKAHKMTLPQLAPSISPPSDITLAPADTLAYLTERTIGENGHLEGIRVLALKEEGSRTPLATFPTTLEIVWNRQGNQQSSRLLLKLAMPDCEQVWLFLYEPRGGITKQWLTSPDWAVGSTQMAWIGENILFFARSREEVSSGVDDLWQYSLLTRQTESLVRPQGQLERNTRPLGWHSANKQIVALESNRTINLIDLASGNVADQIPLSTAEPSHFTLNEDGNYLSYTEGAEAETSQEPSIHILNLTSRENAHLLAGREGDGLFPAYGAEFTARLLVVSQAVKAQEEASKRLLTIDPIALQISVVSKIDDSTFLRSQLTNALTCSDNRVLFVIERQEECDEGSCKQHELQLWQHDGQIKSLLVSDEPIYPLACR